MAGEVKLVLAGILSALLACGMYEHAINIEPNKCEMTYMFQRPDFIVSLLILVHLYLLFTAPLNY